MKLKSRVLGFLVIFLFLINSCSNESIVEVQNTSKGSMEVSIDKVSIQNNFAKIIVVFERDGFARIEKVLNLNGDNTLSFSMTDLASGVWNVGVQFLNTNDDVLYYNQSKIQILPNLSITLFLSFDSASENILFNVSLGNTNEKNLIALYPFYGDANDYSGLNNNGIVYGAVLTKDRFGNENGAYLFDGIDDYIRIPDNNSLTPSNQKLTIAAWLKNDGSRNKAIIYKGDKYNNREYAMGISENALAGFSINNHGMWHANQISLGSIMKIKDNQWYFFTATWDGNQMKIYVNGKLENSRKSNAKIRNFNSDLFIGTYGGEKERYAYKGIIDDLAIFSEALSADEIKQIYVATK